MQWRFLVVHPAAEPTHCKFHRERDHHQCWAKRDPDLDHNERDILLGISGYFAKRIANCGLTSGFTHGDDQVHGHRQWRRRERHGERDDHGQCARTRTDDCIQRFPHFDYCWWLRDSVLDDDECDLREHR